MAWTLTHAWWRSQGSWQDVGDRTVISDNGTNFVGAAREFKECFKEWDRDAMCERLARGKIIWKFNPPGAPHLGGIWERLVRSCKKAMFEILGNRRLTLPLLTTTMWLVEQTLNARPLTPVSDDPEDLEALTHNHFLLGRPVVAAPLMPDADRYVDCRKMYKVAQAYNRMIWNRLAKEYLPKWNIRSKWATDDESVLKVGELAWLMDESVRRQENEMARATEVFPGADGVIRSALIRTADGVLRRPALKLAPVFYECFRDEKRAGDVGARDTKTDKTWNFFTVRKFMYSLIWTLNRLPQELHACWIQRAIYRTFCPLNSLRTLEILPEPDLTFKSVISQGQIVLSRWKICTALFSIYWS